MSTAWLWYTTRGAGMVSLLLLTAVTVLGVLTVTRFQAPGWPRLVTIGFHRLLAHRSFRANRPLRIALAVTGKVSEHENVFMRVAKRIYLPLLARAIRFRGTVALVAVVIVIASGAAATRMGFEFIPSLDEGDLAITATRIPGTSLTQSLNMQAALERRVKRIPEVETFFTRSPY